MKLRLSIWTMLIAGSLLSAPTTRAGQIPWNKWPITPSGYDVRQWHRVCPTGITSN